VGSSRLTGSRALVFRLYTEGLIGRITKSCSIYFPINTGGRAATKLMLIDGVYRMWSTREELIKRGEEYYTAKSVMSVQRVFHRSRVTRFPVIELGALRETLERQAATEPPEAK
jgi:hypothetical protein